MKLGKFTKFSELTSNLGFFLPNELISAKLMRIFVV